MSETELTLEMIGKGEGLPPFSARECTQTLTPLPQGTLRRTINGELVYVGHKGHRKFRSVITCKDKTSPAFEGLWKGALLRVGCIQPLTQAVPQGSKQVQLEREALALHLYDISGKRWPIEDPKEQHASIPPAFPGGFLTYRPRLLMVLKEYHLETDEWSLSVGWRVELEEQ